MARPVLQPALRMYRLHAIDATSTKQYRIIVNNNGNITIVYPLFININYNYKLS